MVRPVDAQFPVSQEFGSDATAGVAANSDPSSGTGYLVYLYGNYQPFGHAGQDIACPIGTPVHAIADGTVIWADWGSNLPGDDTDAGYRQRWYMYKNFPGIVTLIQHDGWISMYGHLSSNDAAPVGARVTEGQLIGLSGNTKAPGVSLGAHLHVGALVDMSYSCGNGLIYGCTDPEPYYGSGSISVQSATITPVQEDDIMATIEELTALLDSRVDELTKRTDAQHVETRKQNEAQHLQTQKVVIDGTQAQSDVTRGYLRDSIPAAVLNKSFQLADGTVTNLAGILAAINAKPVAASGGTVTNVSADPVAIAAAVISGIQTQWKK